MITNFSIVIRGDGSSISAAAGSETIVISQTDSTSTSSPVAQTFTHTVLANNLYSLRVAGSGTFQPSIVYGAVVNISSRASL